MKMNTNIPQTVSAKYVFLDIVDYSIDRSVEAQTDILDMLNHIVRTSVNDSSIPLDKVIFIPTGDGLCVVLFDIDNPYDIHVSLALKIVSSIHEHNLNTQDKMRRFDVRVGINTNIDNVVIDINNNRNIAGAGINMAQRIMSLADAGQILVGQAVVDILRNREKYMNSFKKFKARVKHGLEIDVYQYIQEEALFLNNNLPNTFKEQSNEPKLSEVVAYYILNAINMKDFFIGKKELENTDFAAICLLWFLANDSFTKSKISEYDKFKPKTPFIEEFKGDKKAFDFFRTLPHDVSFELSSFIIDYQLKDFNDYFYGTTARKLWYIVSDLGEERLKKEYPDIYKEVDFYKNTDTIVDTAKQSVKVD